MLDGLAARNGGRAGLAALAAIVLLGLGLRVGEAWDGRPPVYDAAAYAAIAANLERGEGFTVGAAATQPSSNYSPGLPLLVAGLYELDGGVHERLARLLLAALGALAVPLAYLLARRLMRAMSCSPPYGRVNSSPVAGLVAAAAVAIYPALLEYQGMLMSEPLAATLLAGAALAILWAAEPAHAIPRWALPGALLGALALVRPEYLGIAALLGAVVVATGARGLWGAGRDGTPGRWSRGGGRRALGAAATMLAAAAVVIAPWTVRNAEALGRFVPVSTGGGQVLFAGTYLPSDGNPERVGAEVVARQPRLFGPAASRRLRLEQILARLAAARHPALETDQALARMGREQLWDDVSERPLATAGFLARKLWRVWGHGPRQVMREPGWALLHWALVGLGLLGLGLLAWRRRWEAAVLATVLLAIAALGAVLVASPRRLLVAMPLLAACAAVGTAWLAAGWRQRRRPAGAGAAGPG